MPEYPHANIRYTSPMGFVVETSVASLKEAEDLLKLISLLEQDRPSA